MNRFFSGETFVSSGAFVLAVMLVARFVPHPWSALVADDWINLARVESYPDVASSVLNGLRDPNRPLSMAVLDATMKLVGDRPKAYTAISILGNAAVLLLTMCLAYKVTSRRAGAVIAGLFFAICPNVVETTHWTTQVVNEVLCALIGYVASPCLFIQYLNKRGVGWLFASVFAYGLSLFSYESGLFLPFAYLFLLKDSPFTRAAVRALAPFAAVAVFYALWRVTNAFGLNTMWHYPPHMQAAVSAHALIWNAWELANWWVGEHLIEAVLSGWSGFMQLPPWTRRGILLLNVALTAAAWWVVRRVNRVDVQQNASINAFHFSGAWLAAACAPLLISYTAPRLNVLPAVGVSILVGALASRARTTTWLAFAAVPFFICLVALQGTTEQYRQAGELNRRLYARLEKSRADWENKIAIVFNTAGIRERQARRLIGPAGDHERTWAQYGNALLFRGFVAHGMLQLIAGATNRYPHVLHDVENGASHHDGMWSWHARFNPSETFHAPDHEVYRIDLLELAQ